jgi:aldehyde:ferredoxin oxidoreductase
VGPAQGRVNDLDQMLPEYYALRGWTADGRITPETRARFGL